jgi:biopolymer transport protein ExbD
MTAASYIVSKSIPVDLPQGATGEQAPSALAISVDAAGALYLDAQPIAEDALRQRVRAAAKASRDARAIIAADGRTAHRSVVRVIDLLRQEGLNRFAINVRPEDLASK